MCKVECSAGLGYIAPMSYVVLLYYKFTPVADPLAFQTEHQLKCLDLQLKGRVLIANEGLNGTVAGTKEATESYKAYICSKPGFEDIEWKEDVCDFIPFEKMRTKNRKSLVSLGESDGVEIDKFKGKYLEPAQWRKVLETEKDYVLLDVRNKYEAEVGHFEGAIVPPYENFHEFPQWMEELRPYQDKKVLMYCTGGIRCEKFSALLVKNGFKDVNQLHGGILTYGKKEGDAHFKGSCFVFDDRLTVRLTDQSKPVADCFFCGKKEDRMLNCCNMDCNELFVCCDACAYEKKGACSDKCRTSPWLRTFDEKTFRIPFRKKGKVFPSSRFEKTKNSKRA